MKRQEWIASGCALAVAGTVHAGALAQDKASVEPRSVDLLPLLDMYRIPFGSLDGDAPPTGTSNFVGGYTRFTVESNLLQASPYSEIHRRRYHDEDRGVRRWFSGRSVSRVVSMRVALSQPNTSATTTLAASTHDSSRQRGEVWATEIHGRRMLTPYFRVDATTTATIEANLSASNAVQGDVTANLINVVGRAANLLAPTSSLVTSLTEDRLAQASKFVDESISTFFAESLTEKTATEFGPGDWTQERIVITASLPPERRLSGDEAADQIGTWTVALEPPIVSIFSTQPLCPANPAPAACDAAATLEQAKSAFRGLAPYTVLNFKLDGQQTLIQTLRADEAIARAVAQLAASAKASDVAPASVLCNLVAGKAEAIGFNRYDAVAAVWAVAHSDLVTPAGGAALTATTACNSALVMASLDLPKRAAPASAAVPDAPSPPPSPSSQGAASAANPGAPRSGADAPAPPPAASGPPPADGGAPVQG